MLWYWQNKQNSFAPLPKKLTQLKYFFATLCKGKITRRMPPLAPIRKEGADVVDTSPPPPFVRGESVVD